MKSIYTVIAFAVLLLISCGHKKDPVPSITPIGTTYNLNYPFYFKGLLNIPANNPLTVEGVKLGRMLFYEKMLSADNSISCGSCHKQKFAFSDSIAFSAGVGGTLGTRNAMALSNLAFKNSFFWDGKASSLEQQAPFPIQNPLEMHQPNMDSVVKRLQATSTYPPLFKAAFGTTTINADAVSMAISQFERTMVSSHSKFDQYQQGNLAVFTAQERNGYNLFTTHPVPPTLGANCGDCHGGDLLTNNVFLNNGLESVFLDPGREDITGNSSDLGTFKVPSLRNIALTAPYMHDGRFATLQEVLDHYNEHVVASSTISPLMAASNVINGGTYQLGLTTSQISDVIAFLNTLTDSVY